MAHGPNYKVKFGRRREGKTNYYKRYIYVLSNATRLVARLTNKNVIAPFTTHLMNLRNLRRFPSEPRAFSS